MFSILARTCVLFAFFSIVAIVSGSGGHRAAHTRLHLHHRQSAPGLVLAATGSLTGIGLSSTCERVLYQTVSCDEFVGTFRTPAYRGDLGDNDFTASVCSSTCGTSLSIARTRILEACASTPNLSSGYPVVSLIDSLRGGWNETCLKDPTSGTWCNNVIENFPDVEEFSDLPKAQLCSSCLIDKYAAMQQNAYGVYDDENWKPRYDIIVKSCGLTGIDTKKKAQPITLNVTQPATSCVVSYYVTKQGDTCDSIAQGNRVSAGTLYATNPQLVSCANPTSGTKLCLPLSCEKQYQIQSGDDCVTVALANGISWQQLDDWNDMVDCTGTNILGDNPNWGSTVCVSPPGGTFDNPPTNDTNTGVGGPGATGDGYGVQWVDVPTGATLASQTTTNCGQYYTVKQGDTCAHIVVDYNVPSDLFIAANPSLRAARLCDGLLTVGRTYCLHPLRDFNQPIVTHTQPGQTAVQTSIAPSSTASK